MQTARLSFYLRVLPSFLSNVPEVTFSNDIAPLMFLYPPNFFGAAIVELRLDEIPDVIDFDSVFDCSA